VQPERSAELPSSPAAAGSPSRPPALSLSEADDAFRAEDVPALLPLAAPPVPASVVLAEAPTEVLPQQHTVRLPRQAVPDQDDFDFVGPPVRQRAAEVRVLAGPLTPPGQQPKKLIRYDLLAGAALLVALLALVPLLLLRGDPEEMSSAPQLPQAPASDVRVELAPPVELEGQVKLTWTAPRDLDFAVVVAAEGLETRTVLAQRNHSLTVEVEPDLRYCFQVQASDGDDVYTSDPVPFRGATCRES
jgi:hypothetical protein